MDTEAERPRPAEIRGLSGRQYEIERVLQDKGSLLGRVFLATYGGEKFVLKEIPPYNYEVRLGMYERLGQHPHLRGLEDTCPEQSIFIFKHLNEHLLGLAQKQASVAVTKKILKNALQGLAAMHDKDIIHNDIKPNNIFVDATDGPDGITVHQTQLTDFEDSAYCPEPGYLMGLQLGNWMWRSPEAHAEGPIQKASDIFSFAIVCIYALSKAVVFGVLDEELGEGEDKLAIVLERQISYFGNAEAYDEFLDYLGRARPENPWILVFETTRTSFTADYPREPFALWEADWIEEDFRDLIVKMAYFNPDKRISAREALEHRWFKDV